MSSNSDAFKPEIPCIGNQYLEDELLVSILRRILPKEVFTEIAPDLEQFGWRVVKDVWEYGKQAERNPPQLKQMNGWGHRIDRIEVSPAWERLKDVSAEEGLVAIGYERPYGAYSRIYQMAKQYLFAPSSAVFGCPLAMTDGAARLLELHAPEWMKERAIVRLVTRDPADFWTSGQWMTEKTGGSDVGNTETIAQRQPDGSFLLTGHKYFTSAITSEMSITLARIVDEKGRSIKGSKGLSCFYLETRDKHGALNGITVERLKDKLGTKAVPTAELTLNNTRAFLLGSVNRGIATISSILNVTRIYNAIHSISTMRRAVATARDFALRRSAFGHLLKELPLHMRTLATMEVVLRGCMQFTFYITALWGRSEVEDEQNQTSKDEAILLRILTPLAKLFTAKKAIEISSEAIESLGGTGFMEDASDLPALLRNAQVGSIWEGTTNVLSVDVLSVLRKNPDAFTLFYKTAKANMVPSADDDKGTVNGEVPDELLGAVSKTKSALKEIKAHYNTFHNSKKSFLEAGMREFAMLLASTFTSTLLIKHAFWSGNELDQVAASRWSCQQIGSLSLLAQDPDKLVRTDDKRLALNLDDVNRPKVKGDRCSITGKLRSRY